MNRIYCEVKETGEIYRANKAKVIQSIMRENNMTELQACNALLDSSINNPVNVGNGEVAFLGE